MALRKRRSIPVVRESDCEWLRVNLAYEIDRRKRADTMSLLFDQGLIREPRLTREESSRSMNYWLFKSEPECFSFDDLRQAPDQTTGWDGVRNYQARNMLRDQIQRGDLVFYYHSNAAPPAIAGIAVVVEEGHPDPTAFDPSADHYDPKSDPANPAWHQVSIRAVQPIDPPISLAELRAMPELEGMELLRKGSRLSVQPVRAEEWSAILEKAGIAPRSLQIPNLSTSASLSRSRSRSSSPAF